MLNNYSNLINGFINGFPMTEISTKLATIGRNHKGFGSVNAPVYRASTILFDDFEAFSDAYYGRNPVNYGRQGNPIVFELANALSELIDADNTIVTSSGLLAITISLFAYSKAGECVMIPDNVYGPTRAFALNILSKMNIEPIFYDPEITPTELQQLFADKPNISVLYMEAPGSLTFEMQDVKGLCAVAKQHGATTMLDYTWATPLGIKPFELGVDVAIQAVTKYVAGHSDVVMGAISCKQSHYEPLHKASYQVGNYVSGDECFLALRGMRTMNLRLKQQVENMYEVVAWLEKQPEIEQILTPMHPKHQGHAMWKSTMNGGCSLFSVKFATGINRTQIANFCDALQYFGMGYSWGGFESLIVPFKPAEIRTATKHKWAENDWCVRLHIGLEAPTDLIADLDNGFAAMRSSNVAQAMVVSL
jgi:cysteine-S-conjugate beta-lyase